MPPAPSTCLTCGKPFGANRELATIPDASKIAFDPINNRVWRICASCDEWNLLGPEASAAALPELEARYSAKVGAPAATPGFAPITVGNALELLRVSREDLLAQGESVASRLRREADRRRRMTQWALAIGAIGVLGWLAVMVATSSGSPAEPLGLILMFSQVTLYQKIARKIRGAPIRLTSLLPSAGMMLVALAGMLLLGGFLALRHLLLAGLVMLPLMVVTEGFIWSKLKVVQVKLGDGTHLRLNRQEAHDITLAWSNGGTEMSLHNLPGGRSVSGPDVATVFRRAHGWAQDPDRIAGLRTLTSVGDNAYQLLAGVGGLGGLLCALEGFKRESDDRVELADLPLLYLVALDLGMAVETKGEIGHHELRQRALAAAEVAKEAEALDKGE